MAGGGGDDGTDVLEAEETGARARDDSADDLTVERPRRPTHPPLAREPQKISKCAFCRKDHKKCVRQSDDVKCERCQKLKYSCFGGLETALSSSPRRALSRKKCQDCREAKQKCLPVDRVWPNICERCLARGLQCSEPGGTRNRARLNNPQMIPPARPAQDTPQNVALVDSLNLQSQPIINETTVQSTAIEISDDANLSVLSHAAAIHQTDSIPPSTFQDINDDIMRRTRTLARWNLVRHVWNHIIKENRIYKIAAVFLYAPQPDTIGLCGVCTNLGLSREKFVYQPKYDDRRFTRQPVQLQERLWSMGRREKNGADLPVKEIELGSVRVLGKRGYICAFCRLVWKSAQDQMLSSKPVEFNAMVAYATWQIDGRQILSKGSRKMLAAKPQNRRIRIRWRKGASDFSHHRGMVLNDAFIVLLADKERRENFLGHRIEIGESIMLVKGWVEQCRRHHSHNNDIAAEELSDWVEEAGQNFRLIDVEQMRTVSHMADTAGLPQYIALSYTWGTNHPLYYRKDQSQEFERLGSRAGVREIWDKIPRTIQDAIDLVRKLGFRFLWVDMLCSFYEDLKVDHRAMAQIYSKAVLTICAADGDGPAAGLVALHPNNRFPIQHIGKCGPGLELMVSHPAETFLNLSPSTWNKCGWTFRERILSTRCLIFVADRVYWQCRDATASEDIVNDSRESSWSVDMLYNPLHVLGDNGDWSDGDRAIRAYLRCVEEYTPRQLAQPDDMLLAFQSVGQLLCKSLKTDLLYGLPSAFLDLALLWEFKEAPSKSQRRQVYIRGFPTWSWSGWEGPVTYRTSTLAGILSNVSHWISERTWISWYVRDRYNISRLLHKSGRESLTSSIKLDNTLSMLKTEGKWTHNRTREVATGSQQQQFSHPVKWPDRNRSMFFKSVPNLEFDMMDVDREDSEDLEQRDTKYLQFWTWSGFFRLLHKPLPTSSNLGPGLSRFGILDDRNDFCGTIILPDQWAGRLVQDSSIDPVYELVAISEAKNFAPEEFDGWTYYIPKEKEESKWDLWYVLLVEKINDVVVKRVGLGKVFQDAFENSCSPGKEWREFIMA